MARDEFNSVNISNDRQVFGNEFGNFSREEYSFKPENAINKDELNAANKDEINDISEISHKDADDIDKALSQRDRDLIEDAANAGNGGTAASSSGGSTASSASSSSASTAGSSSAAASSGASAAGATAAASATAASAVVVTAFAVVAAAPIILSNAHINEDTLVIEASETEIFYSLDLEETFEDEQYYVSISYEKYTDTQTIVEGANDGVFSDLQSNTTYDFLVVEGTQSEISRILYKEKITTAHYQEVSEVRGATVSTNADLVNNTFTVTLDYTDELNKFSDFEITLNRGMQTPPQNGLIRRDGSDGVTATEQVDSKTFSLEKTTAPQTIAAGEDFILSSGSFSYSLSYVNSDYPDTKMSIPTESNTITFVDNVHKSVVNSATLYEEADFRDQELPVKVNLDFVDDFNKLYQFQLSLQEIVEGADASGYEPEKLVYDLEKINGDQIVKLNNGIHETGIDDRSFHYAITYHSVGVEGELVAASGDITFTDPTYKSVINEAYVDESIAYLDKLFYVHLDYQDDYGYFYDFMVILTVTEADTGRELSYEFNFDPYDANPTTLNIPISFSDIKEGEYGYTIRYKSYKSTDPDEVLTAATGTVVFDDPNWTPSTAQFNGLIFRDADYASRTLTFRLDYDDPDWLLSDYELTIYNHKDNSIQKTFTSSELDASNQWQTISLEIEGNEQFEGGIDVSPTCGFDYTITYMDNGEQKIYSDYNITVEDANGLVNGLDFKFKTKSNDTTKAYANSMNQYFSVYSSYNNYFANLDWSGFVLEISEGDFESGSDQTAGYPIGQYTLSTDTGGWRNVFYLGDSQKDQLDLLNSQTGTFNYRITYFASAEDSMTGDDARSILTSGTISFVDEMMPEINSLSVGKLSEITSDSCYLPIKFEFENDNSDFFDVSVSIKTEDSQEFSINCASNSGMFYQDSDWQIANVSTGTVEDLGINAQNPSEQVTFLVYCSGQSPTGGDPIYTQTVELSLEDSTDDLQFYGMRCEDMMISNYESENTTYQITVNNFIFNGVIQESYSPRILFVIESGSGSKLNEEQVTTLDTIPVNMSDSSTIYLGTIDDSYFVDTNQIVMSIYFDWTDSNNNYHKVPLCEHHTFYKQV